MDKIEFYNNFYDKEFFTNKYYKIMDGESQIQIEKEKLKDREIIQWKKRLK